MSDQPADWAFARTPKWIAGHALAAVLIAVFVLAGFWQWSRHREVSERNDRIEARRDLPVVGVDELVSGRPDEIEFRLVEVDGRWDPSGQLAIRSRSLGGASGCHVVTPLLVGDGSAVLVTRGWVPLADCDDAGVTAHPPPDGTWTVTGLVRPTQTRGSFGATDAAEGVLRTMNRVDVDRIDEQYGPALVDVYVELAAAEASGGAGGSGETTAEPATPTAATAPVPVPPPSLSDGPHLGYTVQWFVFALIGLVGYPLVLRRQARPRHGPPGTGRPPPVRPPTPADPPPPRPSARPTGRAPPASSRS